MASFIENEILNGTNAYHVEYMFENVKQSRDVQVYFTESFDTLRFFEVDNINMGDGEQMEMNLITPKEQKIRKFGTPVEMNQSLNSFGDQKKECPRIRRGTLRLGPPCAGNRPCARGPERELSLETVVG